MFPSTEASIRTHIGKNIPDTAQSNHPSGLPRNEVQSDDSCLINGLTLEECIGKLINQWKGCIEELQQLQRAAGVMPVRGLNNLLRVQEKALERVIQKHQQQTKEADASSSSSSALGSLPTKAISPAQYFGMKSCCWDDRWSIVKKCRGLVYINKDFPRSPRLPVPPGSGWLAYKDQPFQEKPIAVDAVVDGGATWLKFIAISPKTLEYQIVTEGWESEDDEGDQGSQADNEDRDSGLGNTEFADMIHKIILAARWNHCRYLHLALPGLREGESESIDRMLNYIRRMGLAQRAGKLPGHGDVSITVSCANSALLTDPGPPSLEIAISNLVSDRNVQLVGSDCKTITSTANLDPSALVALVSDLHHGPVPLQPPEQQQIIAKSYQEHETTESNELEAREDILANVLYPALRSRELVCTRFAARYFRQVVDAIATHSEEVRAALILSSDKSAEEIRRELQKWSAVPLPEDLRLPVRIVDDVEMDNVQTLVQEGTLPSMALGVARDLSRLNRSVYFYGWANRITTITGHRGIERQIHLSLATHWAPDSGDETPPDMWHRHIGGYLAHRDKPKDWRGMLPDAAGKVPDELIRWTKPWTTWGRGISTYGLPDTKTWDGVGHADCQSYGRRLNMREERAQQPTAAAAAKEPGNNGDHQLDLTGLTLDDEQQYEQT
ncbi:hypothetical protein QBC46DRAFT_401401 [Diplogelasinospora grovesii]|uniref:DUF1308 domain-containing protein n=1 Tax=Diplogelasinospora grovesii TaxID=303347 RepID=A0AAN6RXQ1_9PEZI|nr:hypothetical protein QBC46DRAFT_401401 [Diplogelasinospora grovesii]